MVVGGVFEGSVNVVSVEFELLKLRDSVVGLVLRQNTAEQKSQGFNRFHLNY